MATTPPPSTASASLSASSPATTAAAVNPRTGKRTYMHGGPIATVTVKLLSLPAGTRAKTVGQVSQMLEHEYKAMEILPVPHGRNLDGIASGILNVVNRELRQLL